MSRRSWHACAFTALALVSFASSFLHAGGTRIAAVGGISIDAQGVVRLPTDDARSEWLKGLREQLGKPGGELVAPVAIRKISLRNLEAVIAKALATGAQLPDEVRYLAGLQRIQYVLVYPEQNDIVLAGPAEGWALDQDGNVVGITTGRPVLHLDDLLVALRTVQQARQGGLSCSIDPTAEGRQRLEQLLSDVRRSRQRINPKALEPQMRAAFGPQQITLRGVPQNSRLARILVAADYHMKRLAMNLEPSPIRELPSYVHLIQKGSRGASNPRWWLACNYEPLGRSDDGLAWEIRGPGVKAMTEDEFVAADGTVKGTGKTSDAAQKWADLMTAHYEELSRKNVVFGDLRNVMDLCVVAAVIEANDLRGLAGCTLDALCQTQSGPAPERWNAPKTVEPQCSFLRASGEWIVTASGGVQVESWQSASQSAAAPQLAGIRADGIKLDGLQWWSN